MSLVSICTAVAADLGITNANPPIFGSQIPAARRLFAQARKAAIALHRRCNWEELVVEYDFTAAGNSDFPLPADFGWMVADTAWEASRYWRMRGAMSPQQWRMYKNSIYGRATIWRRWRIRLPTGANPGHASVFSVDPTITSDNVSSKFVFEYVSKNWCLHADGTTGPDWSGDTDTCILDEYLVELGTRWRMLRRMGLAYDDDQDEYDRETDKAVARNGGTATLELVPNQHKDFIGQYTLGAFPPAPPPPQVPLQAAGQPVLLGQPAVSNNVLRPAGPRRRVIPTVERSDC